ncbi:protein mks1 [Phtheirospermum japonicum]|uniref:Protein mks1 n=1 Tax=Phtheirospermum japonicum TaxID=374723 RepID=A0A830D4T6_9LAMI|nr:protein mks1 [Phtheirospermum japonicum]
MNPPGFKIGGSGNRPSPRKELLGPRPTALKLNKDSYKIRKPPVAPPPHHQPPPEAPPQPVEDRQPVIIYAVSPKVIHTTVSDFMGLVQRLTGNAVEGGAASGSGAGNLSPAARLASIEKTSPSKEREVASCSGADNNQSSFIVDLVEDGAVELSRVPGILSPAPASLPPISAGLFSPAGDPFMMGYNMFIPSPSSLFSAPMVSPSPSSSSCDLFNPFFDF